MRGLGVLAGVLAAGPAHARPVDPQVPRDPSHVRHVHDALGVAWLGCLVDHYPEDIAPKSDKVAISAAFQPDGGADSRKLRVDLTIELATIDGARVEPSAAEQKLIACVETRVEAKRYHRDGFDPPGSYGMLDPGWQYPVVENGAIGTLVAGRYLSHHVVASRCPDTRTGWKVVVDVRADGRVAKLTAFTYAGDPHPETACLVRKLKKRLRFPATGTPSQLSAMP